MVRTRGLRQPSGPGVRRRIAFAALAFVAAAGTAFVAPPAHAATTYTVNSTADTDDGNCDAAPDCTLREAINAANMNPGADVIAFAISGSGVHTITPGPGPGPGFYGLPMVGDQVTIDGTTQGGPGYTGPPLIELDGSSAGAQGVGLWLSSAAGNVVRGLVINRFSSQQMLIDTANNTIAGNYLGTDSTGASTPLDGMGNPFGTYATLRLRSNANNNIIGGSAAADRNVISGGPSAVSIESFSPATTSGNVVEGNNIGVGAGGAALASPKGINVTGAGTTGNTFRRNAIASNTGLGIDLAGNGVTPNDIDDPDTGENNLQNFPVLSSATNDVGGTTITGTLNSTPNSTFRVELFSSDSCDSTGYGEGETYLDYVDVNTDASGDATINTTVSTVATGDEITSTATDSSTKDTSEFSACQTVVPAAPIAPNAPTGVTAGAGSGQAEVRWIAAGTNGGSAIDHYTITSSPATSPVTVNAPATSGTVTGLTNGTAYTFTVTATNTASQSSGPSAASESVTPVSGAPAPETVSQQTSAGGTASTGTTATATDPTNTTVKTPNNGVVSIGEGAMTGSRPGGGSYFGQQIDITAPDATASNPMTFTFVTDCSVLPAAVSSCSAGPPPAAAFAAAAAPAPSPPGPTSATVQARDYSYSPQHASVRIGGKVTVDFRGPHQHSATDSRGVGANGGPLFDTGRKSAGQKVMFTAPAAGLYAFRSTAPGDPTSMTGDVSVPMQLSQTEASTGSPVTVTWASSRPNGYRFDV